MSTTITISQVASFIVKDVENKDINLATRSDVNKLAEHLMSSGKTDQAFDLMIAYGMFLQSLHTKISKQNAVLNFTRMVQSFI